MYRYIIYIYIYILSSSRKPSGRYLSMVSVVDIIQRSFYLCFQTLVFFLWLPSSQETFLLFFLWFPSLVVYDFRRGRQTCFYGFRRRIVDGFCRRRRIQNVTMYRVIPCCLVFRTGFRRCFVYAFRCGRKTCLYGFRRWFFNGFRRGKERLFMVSVLVFVLDGLRLLQDRGSLSDGNHKKEPSGRFRDELSMYVYIYIYVHMCIYIYIYYYRL